MKRKLVSVLLAASMVVTGLTACGGGNETAGNGETQQEEPTGGNSDDAEEEKTDDAEEPAAGSAGVSGSDSAETVLKWACWDIKTATYWQAIADAYTKDHPDVRIEMTDLGASDYDTVLSTELSGSGSEFDIVTIRRTRLCDSGIQGSSRALERPDRRGQCGSFSVQRYNRPADRG